MGHFGYNNFQKWLSTNVLGDLGPFWDFPTIFPLLRNVSSTYKNCFTEVHISCREYK